jgi:molybdopterin/thiamine biosynthesis adenylyltransferase
MPASRLALALRKLDELGFKPIKRPGPARCFVGELRCAKGPVKVRLEISDWEFTTYPTLVILERPPFLPALTPHVSIDGFQCYFVQGRVVLDRYRPDHAIWQCVEQARRELDRLSGSPTYREREFEQEFGANWEIGQQPLPIPVLLADVAGDGAVPCFGIGVDDGLYIIAASDEVQVKALAEARGWPVPTRRKIGTYIVRSAKSPTLPSGQLPATIAQVFAWIKSWDPAAMKRIHAVLGQREWLEFKAVQFLIESPAGWFGFFFELSPNRKLMHQRKPSGYRQHLYSNGNELPITRVSVRQISPDFIHSRNLLFPSLKDRRITLIGCGAIGGYLAQALVKLGAGSGTGLLTLIDPDLLDPGNLGRHFLGMDGLYKHKVVALKEALTKQFSHANIVAEPRSATYPSDIAGDLVIDATGEEAVSEAINAHRRSTSRVEGVPVLHTWIVGNGECVQALWVDQLKYACFRCMRRNDPARSKRFPVVDHDPETRVVGCNAYTPYAVSASMSASALAIDMIVDWLKGDVSPRFRTRNMEGAKARSIKNQNVKPLEGCPGCAVLSS